MARYSGPSVTGGDTHNHYGGDGGQIDHLHLANIGTLTHAQLEVLLAAIQASGSVSSIPTYDTFPTFKGEQASPQFAGETLLETIVGGAEIGAFYVGYVSASNTVGTEARSSMVMCRVYSNAGTPDVLFTELGPPVVGNANVSYLQFSWDVSGSDLQFITTADDAGWTYTWVFQRVDA